MKFERSRGRTARATPFKYQDQSFVNRKTINEMMYLLDMRPPKMTNSNPTLNSCTCGSEFVCIVAENRVMCFSML